MANPVGPVAAPKPSAEKETCGACRAVSDRRSLILKDLLCPEGTVTADSAEDRE